MLTSENNISTLHIAAIIVVPVVVVVLVLLSILPAVVVIRAIKNQPVHFDPDLQRPIYDEGEFEGAHNA
jgi:hypothetical protein